MAIQYTDEDIERLLAERKPLASDIRLNMRFKARRGHQTWEQEVQGASGASFSLTIRKADLNPLDFSVILAVEVPESGRRFRLRRYNGKSHQHRNKGESGAVAFYEFHVHTATERYQELGAHEDHFAEPTERFATWEEALDRMLADCGFELPPAEQLGLFAEVQP